MLADSVETLGMGLRMKTKKFGAKEKAERSKCDVKVMLTEKNRAFQKSGMRGGVRKVLSMGLVPVRTWRGQAFGIASTGR